MRHLQGGKGWSSGLISSKGDLAHVCFVSKESV